MRQHLCDLLELQKIDLLIREIEQSQQAVPAKLGTMDSTVSAVQLEISQLVTQRDQLIKESKTLEGTVQAETHKLRKWEARLNEMRNHREHLALSREVEASKRSNRDAEEKLQEISKQRKEIDAKLESLQDKLAEEEVDRGAEQEKVDAAVADLTTKINSELARREELLHKVPKALLKKYDSIRAKRLGLGLSAVVDGSCTGCNMKLPPQLYNILQRGTTIEQCPSCHRIIYWDRLLAPEGSEEQKVDASAQKADKPEKPEKKKRGAAAAGSASPS